MDAPLPTHTTGEFQTLATDDPLVAERRSELAEGTVLAGRYRIRHLIGEGGMGDVYLAEHLKIDKEVAIKVLAPQQMRRPRTVGRFLQEAKAASKIRHENVVDITDYGESEGCAFFVMEYLRGEDLSVLLKREGRQPWSRIKPICIQVLRALSAAHAAGVVHRDIKPHNCFVTPRDDGREVVKVIDFGIAKLAEGSGEQLTRTGAIMGTAEYMSPEQGMGADLDGRSDLYSVGVILYRMLTGAVPYQGNNPMAILYQHIHAERVLPSTACPEAGIGPDVDALVLRALAPDRDDRFPTAEAFIAALEAIEDAGAGDATLHARKVARGRLVGAAALVLVLGLGAVGLAALGGDDPPDETYDAVTRPVPATRPDPAGIDRLGPATSAGSVGVASAGAASVGLAAADDPAAADTTDTDADTDPDPLVTAGDTTGASAAALESTGTDDSAALDPSGSEPAPRRALPAQRSSREIRSRLGRIAPKVRSCGKQAGLFPGESVTVRLEIAPTGRVQSAKVMGAFSRKGAACIERAVRDTRFSAARQSQSAEHRFTL